MNPESMEPKVNVQRADWDIADFLRNIMYAPSLRKLRILTLVSALSSLSILVYAPVTFSCSLSFVQGLLLPLWGALMVLEELPNPSSGARLRIGIGTGMVVGAAPAAIGAIASLVDFYLLSGQAQLPTTGTWSEPYMYVALFLTLVLGEAFLWLLMLVVSALAGMLAALMENRRRTGRFV